MTAINIQLDFNDCHEVRLALLARITATEQLVSDYRNLYDPSPQVDSFIAAELETLGRLRRIHAVFVAQLGGV